MPGSIGGNWGKIGGGEGSALSLLAPKFAKIAIAPLLILTPSFSPMEKILNLHIEKLPEGVYLATSDELPGLVAQGRTIAETLEIARDVARKLLEARSERNQPDTLEPLGDRFDYPLVVGQ